MDPNKGGDGKGGSGGAGGAGGSGGGAGGSGGDGKGTPWIDSFPAVKGNAEIAARVGTYESPEAALLALGSGAWDPQWREKLAGGDAAKLADLQRYQDPQAMADGLFASKARIREGDLAKPLPKNPNEQELKAYRELHGIPAEAKGYLENLPEGLVLGKDDQPVFESLATKVLHKHNLPPAVAHDIVKWYGDFVQEEQAAVGEQDGKDREETEDALRKTWGNDFRANANIMRSYLSGLPQAVSEALQNARDIDGRGLMNNPAVVQWLVGSARELQDVSTVLDGSGGANPLLTVEQEIVKIEKLMKSDRKAYNKDSALQEKYRGLLDQRDKLKARGGRAAA